MLTVERILYYSNNGHDSRRNLKGRPVKLPLLVEIIDLVSIKLLIIEIKIILGTLILHILKGVERILRANVLI